MHMLCFQIFNLQIIYLKQICDVQLTCKIIASESHCNTKPCHGQGYCKTSGGSGFICICKLGFKGLQCETGSECGFKRNRSALWLYVYEKVNVSALIDIKQKSGWFDSTNKIEYIILYYKRKKETPASE